MQQNNKENTDGLALRKFKIASNMAVNMQVLKVSKIHRVNRHHVLYCWCFDLRRAVGIQ